MSSITTGTGLVSGINIQQLVTQLISIEKRPADILKAQIDKNTTLKNSLQTLSLRLASTNLAATRLGAGQSFTSRSVSTSSTSVSATVGKGATVGSFAITPKALATTSQLLSTGFNSTSQTFSAGKISISQGGFVDRDTKLSSLNGGAGVQAGSIKILDQAGGVATIDLSGATTARQVVDAINSASGANVTASLEGDSFRLVDNSGGAGALTVQNVSGGKTANDLGLTSLNRVGANYTGADVVKLAAGTDLRLLNDGNGVRNARGLDDFNVVSGGVSFNVRVDSAKTVGDVLDAVNNNASNTGVDKVTAQIVNDKLQLVNGSGQDVTVTVQNNSGAARDLGLTTASTTGATNTGAGGSLSGAEVFKGLGTVLLRSLNGGAGGSGGLVAGQININGSTIDLSAASTLQDVIAGINSAAVPGVTAKINSARNGVDLANSSGSITISDVTGNLAAKLNVAGTSATGTKSSGDLNTQFVGESTKLTALNGGSGVPKGKFKLTDGLGNSATVDLTQDTDDTIGAVVNEINTRGLAVNARLNDAGDGIIIERTAGTSALQVLDLEGGTAAKSLHLTPNTAGDAVDGRFKFSIDVAAADKLTDIVTKLQTSGAPIQANIVNDGSGLNPYRLNLTSKNAGLAGELLVDGSAIGLNFSALNKAQDSVVILGSTAGGASPIQITSNNTTFSDITPGVSVTINSVSSSPVTVSVSQDQTAILDSLKKFVDSFNAVRQFIDDNSTFNGKKNSSDSTDATDSASNTSQSDSTTSAFRNGIFFSDGAVRAATNELSNFINKTFTNTGSSLRSLGQLGISLESDGHIALDESAFSAAYSADPSNVEKFFTTATNGFAAQFKTLNDQLTDVTKGLLTGRELSVDQTITTQNSTLDALNARLSTREQRLYSQFYAMEAALSKLQGQQSALTQLSTLASSFSTAAIR